MAHWPASGGTWSAALAAGLPARTKIDSAAVAVASRLRVTQWRCGLAAGAGERPNPPVLERSRDRSGPAPCSVILSGKTLAPVRRRGRSRAIAVAAIRDLTLIRGIFMSAFSPL